MAVLRATEVDHFLGWPGDILTPGPPTAGPPQVSGYEVEAVLGRGGMGVVYKARQRALDRPVAIKMLLAGPFASRQELGRSRRETAALASLRHPNIVQVFDAGVELSYPTRCVRPNSGFILPEPASAYRNAARYGL